MGKLSDFLKSAVDEINKRPKTVNGVSPDEKGNVEVSGLPEGAAAHQMLVTDADGNEVWEDRTHYEVIELEVLLENHAVNCDSLHTNEYGTETYGYYGWVGTVSGSSEIALLPDNYVVGQTYRVTLDGTEYDVVCSNAGWLGNPYLCADSGTDNGLPFGLRYSCLYVPTSGKGTHTLSVASIVATLKQLDKKFVPVLSEDKIPASITRDTEVPDLIPSYYGKTAANVNNAAGETTTAAEFNALLKTLRDAGVIAQPDPWDDLFASIDAGTYATDFAVGDVLPLHLNEEGCVNAQIVAFDTDVDASGNTVPVTFVTQHVLNSSTTFESQKKGMTDRGSGNYGVFDVYDYFGTSLHQTINSMESVLPQKIAGRIVKVAKSYTYAYDSNDGMSHTYETSDSFKLWALSADEVEKTYSLLSTSAGRAKTRADGDTMKYYLRSASSSIYYAESVGPDYVTPDGDVYQGKYISSSHQGGSSGGIVFGFCVGQGG